MGEINNSNDEDIIEGEGNQDLDESQNDDGAGNESEGDDTPDDDNSGDGDEADKGDKPESKPTLKADEEPKSRKRNIDFIKERQERKAQKNLNKGDDAGADDDDDIDSDDAKIIQKQITKVLSPFLQKQMQDEDTQEIGDFVKQNPDFAPYAETVKRYAQHPTRRDMPIKALFYEVAGDDLLKIGAKRAQKARDLAKESGAGGGSGGWSSEKGVWDLSPEEFATQQEALRNKPRE